MELKGQLEKTTTLKVEILLERIEDKLKELDYELICRRTRTACDILIPARAAPIDPRYYYPQARQALFLVSAGSLEEDPAPACKVAPK